ncbi:MAG: hypothetical protein ACU833_14755 [Gammaproteobacteria bacterium]
MHRKLLWTLLAAAVAGCYENENVVIHQPHVYRGKTDFHAQRPGSLITRFRLVQTDR